jgi:hypothetical protein
VEVESAQVKTRRRDALDRLSPVEASGGVRINLNLASAHTVPDGRDAEDYRPISGVLPDRSIAIIHELVAVVFELLSKVVQHRPRLMASRAAQAILPGEGRQGVRGLAAGEDDRCENQSDSRERTRQLEDVAGTKTTNVQGRAPRQDQIKIWFVKVDSNRAGAMVTCRTKTSAELGRFPHFLAVLNLYAVVLPPNQSWILMLSRDKRQEVSTKFSGRDAERVESAEFFVCAVSNNNNL